MNAYVQATALTDFPPEVVQLISTQVADNKQLQKRAALALVCKSFAAAMKKQTHIEVLSKSLVGPGPTFSTAAKACLAPTFRNITQLYLPDVHSYVFSRVFRIVNSCPLLKVLSIVLKPERVPSRAEPPIYAYFWQLLDCNSTEVLKLRQLTVISVDRMVMEAMSCSGPLSQHGSLECIIGCSLDILRGLAHCHRNNLTASSVMLQAGGYHAASANTDQAMLLESKSLRWLDIGHQCLHAPFTSIVYGSLTPETAPTLHLGLEAHVYGMVEAGVNQVDSVLSLKYNVFIVSPSYLDGLFPQLQHLDIQILGIRDCGYALSSALRHASIKLEDANGTNIMLQVTGATPKRLAYLHLEGPQVTIPAKLYHWAENNGVSPKTQSHVSHHMHEICILCTTQAPPKARTVLHVQSSESEVN